jgi:hypothetical protein
MWFRGKQHGLGVYTVPGQEPKCGLWEDGKRIEWFDNNQVAAILNGQYEFSRHFTRQPESAQNVESYYEGNGEEHGLGFRRPNNFDEMLNQVKQ